MPDNEYPAIVYTLRPAPRRIVMEYYRVKKTPDKLKGMSIIRVIANNLGYELNKNNSNSFVSEVLKKYIEN